MPFFNFIRRFTDLGVGTGNAGLLPFQTLPDGGSYLGNTGPRKWNIQRSLSPVSNPGYMILNQRVVPVSLQGSTGGLSLSGQYQLQPLAAPDNS